MRIANRHALVTGGGSGLGEAVARLLATKGAIVSVLDVDAAKAQAVAADVKGTAVTADVSSPDQVRDALARASELSGVATIVVNCAGVGSASRVIGRSGAMDLADFEKVIRINLIGTFNVLRLAAHAMSLCPPQEDCRGTIVNTASVAAFDGQIGQAAYAASKGGVVSMALPITREFAQFGIRVNTVAPGIFRTPLLETLPEPVQDSLAQGIPFPQRLGDPAEFAHSVVFCIENDYLNGEVIRLDAAHRLPPR